MISVDKVFGVGAELFHARSKLAAGHSLSDIQTDGAFPVFGKVQTEFADRHFVETVSGGNHQKHRQRTDTRSPDLSAAMSDDLANSRRAEDGVSLTLSVATLQTNVIYVKHEIYYVN